MYIPDKTMWSGIGYDWMSHELIINVLQQGPKYEYNGVISTGWLLAEMHCCCYLTRSKKFSLGDQPLINRIDMRYQDIHYMKKNLLQAMTSLDTKPENFVKFDFWYNHMLPENKCFYTDKGKPFPLRFTDAMTKNIYKKVDQQIPKKISLTNNILQNENPEPLWVDVHWTLTEIKKLISGEPNNAELPSEVWRS